MADIRTYTHADDSTVDPSGYETGTGANARLRKINLNVDLATQAELNDAFSQLSNRISSDFDFLSNAIAGATGDLTAYYTKTEVNAISSALSGQVTADIAAEATAREAADEAITASLSAYALSTTVADAYKVTVANPTEIEGDKLRYEVLQGGQHAGYLDIAKDQFVSAAAFDGTVLTLTLRDGSKISTDLGELANYTGVDGENALVNVNENNHQISVYVKDYASKTYVDEVSATANAEITAAETAAKSYTDEVSTALSNAFEPRVSDNETVSEFVREMSATWDGGGSALQAISAGTDGTYVTTTVTGKDANNKQTVAVAVTTSDISSETAGLAVNTDVKAYVDSAVGKVDKTFVKGVDSQTTAYVQITGDTSLTGNKIIYVDLKSNVTDAIDKVNLSGTAWDNAAAVAGVVESTSATWNEVSAKIDTSKVVAAANELSVLSLSALSDYNDIDEIITEVEKIKGALINFTTALEAPPTPPASTKTIARYSGENTVEYDLTGTLNKSDIPNQENLVAIEINGVTAIGDDAFATHTEYTSMLTSVTIGNTITAIGDSAFNGCGALTSITIPNTVTSIGYGAFTDTGIESVTIPGSVSTIESGLFSNSQSLTSVTLESGVTTINNEAFSGITLNSLIIPASVVSINYDIYGSDGSAENVTFVGRDKNQVLSLLDISIEDPDAPNYGLYLHYNGGTLEYTSDGYLEV